MSNVIEESKEVAVRPADKPGVLEVVARSGLADLAIIAASFLVLGQLISLHRVTDFMIFCIFVMSYDLLYGYLGRLSFGHMLFLGTGAYASSLFLIHVNTNPLLAIVVALAAGAVVAMGTGFILARTEGAPFALIALAFNQVGFFLADSAFQQYTGGANGISSSPGVLGFLDFSQRNVIFGFTLFCVLVVFFALKLLTRSSYGILIRSIKEDETRVKFLGYNTGFYKWLTYVISGTIAALPGALNTLNYKFISPSFIDTHRNVEVIFAALIGGAGNLYGALVGGVGYMLISNYLAAYIERWEMFLGFVLLILVFNFRKGLTGFVTERVIPRLPYGSRRPGVERR